MNRRNKPKTEPFKLRCSHWLERMRLVVTTSSASSSHLVASFWHRLPVLHRRILTVIVPLYLVIFLIPNNPVPKPESLSTLQRVEVPVNPRSLSETEVDIVANVVEVPQWKEYTVEEGDTLSQVFRVNQLSMADLNALAKIEGDDKPLSRIKQGQLIRFKYDLEGKLDILQIEKGSDSVMFFRLSDGGFGRSK